MRQTVVALALLVLSATSMRAQDVARSDTDITPPRADSSVTASSSGPSVESARVAARQPSVDQKTVMMSPAHKTDQGTALMIVGGAAVLTGIVVGGNAGYAISISGAVIGLIGLYQYLQ